MTENFSITATTATLKFNNMFKFIKTKGSHPSAERQRLQKDLFSYRRTLQHGFPHKPTALAWDPCLRLLCIGTATGAIKVFGRPGVEFYGQHQNASSITKIVFLPSQGRVVSLCDDNSLHLWEVNKNSLVEIKNQALEGKLKKISYLCVVSSGKVLLLGTEGGNIYLLDLVTFTMTPDIIYQDVVMQNVPQNYKVNPGAVEAIEEQPTQPDRILIGYNRGLIVLWNRIMNVAVKTFIASQQVESLHWMGDGKSFTSSHNDGSYICWMCDSCDDIINNSLTTGELTDGDKMSSTTSTSCITDDPITIYGPYPCKAIPKLIKTVLKAKSLVVFSGGLPRSSGGDKYTVSVVYDDGPPVAFDFTSKVIDFHLIATGSDCFGPPEAVVVLAEEEIVLIDLEADDWKMINLPYLVSLHASAITCSQHVSGVPDELWEQLKEAGRLQTNVVYSMTKQCPIDGGHLLCPKMVGTATGGGGRELLLTGHEDGTVRFWDATGVTLTPIYKFSTAQFFSGDEFDDIASSNADDDGEEEWPPYRKVGVFDPYSDDPRLAVKRVVLCPLSGWLAVAGTAGHTVLAKFDTEILDKTIDTITMNIVNDRDGFVWKGHNQLTPKTCQFHQTRGFQTKTIVQVHPPAAITACALQTDWGLMAVGTAHGLALFDYIRTKPIMVKCTLNPNDLSGSGGDAPISRRKSFKKSLRESFRRLRKGRSMRRTTNPTSNNNNNNNNSSNPGTITVPSSGGRKLPDGDGGGALDAAKPVERQIEARPADDSMSSFVRCLYFARTFLVNVQNATPTLWAGTNNGTVYTFTVSVPAAQKRTTDDVICNIAKEIQLKHRAPVIGIAVLDGASRPLPDALEVERGVAPLPDTMNGPHRVIIASEEQFKVFTLPAVKAFCKYKLTAHEGARVRKMAFGTFTCTVKPETSTPTNATAPSTGPHMYSEIDLLCLTNLGDCLVLSIPDLKRQLNAAAIKREDINGISSLVFTKNAEAFYLHSSSELQRISLAANKVTSARCYLTVTALNDSNDRHETDNDGDLSTTAEMTTNGLNGLDDRSSSSKMEEGRENGDETPLNMTVSSSVGDVTIDSVRDYTNNPQQMAQSEEITKRISNLSLTVQTNRNTTTTTSNGDSGASNGQNDDNNSTMVVPSVALITTANVVVDCCEKTGEDASELEIEDHPKEVVQFKAPLALAEELMDTDTA